MPRTHAADPSRPNILFAIADDWGLHAGAYGTRWVKTPAFDRVAREGLLFQNAYTPMAKCAPSRAIVLTGRHLWQNEEAGNHLAVFPPKLKSWPEALMDKGWHMGITGKGWGPGIANDANGKPRLITGRPFNKHKASPPAEAMANTDYAANFKDFLDAAPQDAPWCFGYGAIEPHRGYEFQAGVKKGGKQLADSTACPPTGRTTRPCATTCSTARPAAAVPSRARSVGETQRRRPAPRNPRTDSRCRGRPPIRRDARAAAIAVAPHPFHETTPPHSRAGRFVLHFTACDRR